MQIDGLAAPVATWSGNRIVAYVPEAAGLGSVAVQVTNSSGQPSNSLSLNVTNRQADGRVRWRFRMNGPYSEVRPVVGSDGTIYAIDAFMHLYALTPDGGLKWIVQGAGDKGVAVGTDGSVYVGSEGAIRAFHSDGSDKWTFLEDPYAFILVGISVGPDGNLYAVATEGMGVFSLTPGGDLRWQVPEPYQRLIVPYNEITFGSNGGVGQMYFYANRHLRALTLGGTPVFEIAGGLAALEPAMSPAIGPDGSVHTDLNVYAPGGSLLWSFPTPDPYNVFTNPDVGTDGVHYFGQNLSQLFALNPDGSQRWHVTLDDYVQGPVVDPSNAQLVMGSANTGDQAGFVLSTTAGDGQELWRVVLPVEDPTVWNPTIGMWGFNQFVDTRARFASDGLSAYLVTATATGDNATSKSFVYALDASLGDPPPPPPPAPEIFTISPPSGAPDGGSTMADWRLGLRRGRHGGDRRRLRRRFGGRREHDRRHRSGARPGNAQRPHGDEPGRLVPHGTEGLARRLPGRRGIRRFPSLRRKNLPARDHRGLRERPLLPRRRRVQGADGGLPPQGRVRFRVHAASLRRRLRRRRVHAHARIRRGLDRAAGGRGNHRRMRRRELLSGRARLEGADGRVSAEDRARFGLPAAPLRRGFRRRGLPEPLRRLDRATGGRGNHRRMRNGNYCPSHPSTRGQMSVFLDKTFHLP